MSTCLEWVLCSNGLYGWTRTCNDASLLHAPHRDRRERHCVMYTASQYGKRRPYAQWRMRCSCSSPQLCTPTGSHLHDT